MAQRYFRISAGPVMPVQGLQPPTTDDPPTPMHDRMRQSSSPLSSHHPRRLRSAAGSSAAEPHDKDRQKPLLCFLGKVLSNYCHALHEPVIEEPHARPKRQLSLEQSNALDCTPALFFFANAREPVLTPHGMRNMFSVNPIADRANAPNEKQRAGLHHILSHQSASSIPAGFVGETP